MSFKNTFDFHIHTDNSDDGHHSAMLMCEHAVRRGLRAIAITDHCEANRYRNDRFDRSIRQSFFEARKAKSVFTGKLIVLAGMELGQATQDLAAAEDALGANNYDFVIGSLHNVRGHKDFWHVDFTKDEAVPLIMQYFEELRELIEWGNFDCLAHITYPFRYVKQFDIDESIFNDTIEETLKLAIAKTKALEINTAGLRMDYGKTAPEAWVVKRFKELGGKYVSVGSDAHFCKDVGAGMNEALAVVKDAGFDCITMYQNRQPMQIPIE